MEFDASRLYDSEPLIFEEQVRLEGDVQDVARGGYLAIDDALKKTRAQIEEGHVRCNRLAWGQLPINTRAPTSAAEVKHAIDSASERGVNGDFGGRLQRAARECRSLRQYAILLADALEVARESSSAEMNDRFDAERETELRAQFEANETASRERRYREWRAGQA